MRIIKFLGSELNLDSIAGVGELSICKHDSQYNNYEVYLANGSSINVMEVDMSREVLLEVWKGELPIPN